MDKEKLDLDWLDPEYTKSRLIRAGLFLLAYEFLKASIIDGIKDFYCTGFDKRRTGDPWIYSSEYETRVLSKSKHIFEASLLWFQEMNVINDEDVAKLQDLREYRNMVAHQIPAFLFDEDRDIQDEMLDRAATYLRKIDNFWGQIDVATDPDFANKEVDYEGIVSIRTLALKYIIDICREESEAEGAV